MADALRRFRAILLFLLVVVVLAGLLVLYRSPARSGASLLDQLTPPPPSPEPTPTPGSIRVYVTGAISHPDVYTLPADSIVKDAVVAAGGAGAEADLERINLASPLSDGQQVHVPRRGEENPPLDPPARSPAAGTGGKVNVNTADAATLETLPGIGPALAQRIIDYRAANGPFAAVDDLVDVPGIGPATLEKLRDHVVVR